MTALQKRKLKYTARHFVADNEPLIVLVIIVITLLILQFCPLQNSKPQKDSNYQSVENVAGISAQIKSTMVTPTPKPLTDKEYILSLPYGSIVWKTYGHESSYGANDGCKATGQFNGFGFAENDNGYSCFSSLREVAKAVSNWFTDYIDNKGFTINQSLCIYRYGHTKGDSCDYADYTLAL